MHRKIEPLLRFIYLVRKTEHWSIWAWKLSFQILLNLHDSTRVHLITLMLLISFVRVDNIEKKYYSRLLDNQQKWPSVFDM